MAELRRLAKLGKLAAAAGRKVGLTLRTFAVLPDADDATPINRVRMAFSIDPEFGMPDELAELERSARAPSHDPEELARQRKATAEEATEMTRRLLDPTKGIL